MKKLFTFFSSALPVLCMLLGQSVEVKAQTIPSFYDSAWFLSTAAPYPGYTAYTPLVGGTRVAGIESGSGYANSIPIGFTFNFKGSNYSFVSVSSNGWLKFGTASNAQAVAGFSTTVLNNVTPGVWPLWGNLDGTGGTATYLTELLPSGNKVFTFEWKNWRFDKTSTAGNISFQCKLYQGSGIIEFWYKQEAGAFPSPLPYPSIIGIGGSSTTADYCLLSDVSPITFFTGATFGPVINERPADNQVFQWYPICQGMPESGSIIGTDSTCPNQSFTVKLYGHTYSPIPAFGATYQWQAAPTATGAWGNLPGGTSPSYSFPAGITTDTFLRCIVTCTNSGLSDTTLVKHITMIKLPYNCYCQAVSTASLPNENIGNVKIITVGKDTLLNNGDGKPAFINPNVNKNYTLFTGLRPVIDLNRDTTYKVSVMGITKDTFAFNPCGVAMFIDYNQNGKYDVPAEMAQFKVLSGTTSNFVDNFTVPNNAVLGITGMRFILKRGATTPADIPACGNYAEGETEDYIVNISYPKCPGPISAGKAYISDTSSCPDYTVTVTDTAHSRNLNGASWLWEYSLDNVNWLPIAGSAGKDTITPVVKQTTYYRLRVICAISSDTTYSNRVSVKLKQPYKCYCYSLADGGVNDTSDITTIVLSSLMVNTGGPHVLNPMSYRMRTDRTDLDPLELIAGKTYPIAVYQTLLGKNHADAKITVFMDYNHNLAYDAPSERVWTAFTTPTNYFIHDSITIPNAVIPNVITGLRFIVNNNVGPNSPSDNGCGIYTSGETEDYLVIFRRPTTSIGNVSNVNDLQIFPNPTSGMVTLSFNTQAQVNNAAVSVTSVTGQQIFSEQYANINGAFRKDIDLSGQPKGIYLITLTIDGQKSVNKLIIQ